ncbi:hypothetical protein D1N53_23690, partial [Clostridioides difficile]
MMGIFILDYYKTFIILISISLVKRVKRNPYKSSKDLINGQAWMPSKGKYSKYLAYENMIAGFINQQYQGETVEENLIT